MEYQVNIIFILIFCFSIVEPIPSPEEGGRQVAHQASNWQKNSNHPRQYPIYPRPQSFYPTVSNTSNRNYNQDYRPHERNYENRHSTGEKRTFYEGPNGRNTRPYTQLANGVNRGEKSLDRNNGRYSPQVERNQQPINRAYAPRDYQRSMSENYANRYRDFTQPQRPGYFDKQITSQNRPASPGDSRYPAYNRKLDSLPKQNSPDVARFIPEAPASPKFSHEINKMLLNDDIQKYLESNHKRYLVLHPNGKVEHVDNLDSIIQNHPHYVMVKAGDIVTNPKSSTLELMPSKPREDKLKQSRPQISEITQRVLKTPINFPEYGYNNPRVPYVTEKEYAQPLSRPVNIEPEDEAVISNEPGLVIMTTLTSIDTLANVTETTTEYYASTPFVETPTDYSTDTPHTVYSTPGATIEYSSTTPYVDSRIEYATYDYSTTESPASLVPVFVDDEDQMFTGTPVEIISEDSITSTQYPLTSEEYSTVTSTTNDNVYLDNIVLDNNFAPQEEEKINNVPPILSYPFMLGKFIRRHLGSILSGNILNAESYNHKETSLKNEKLPPDPLNVTDLLDAITELVAINQSTTESADILYTVSSFPVEDTMYTTPTSMSALLDEKKSEYSDTLSPLNDHQNEKIVNTGSLNPFINVNYGQERTNRKNRAHRNATNRKTTEYLYDPIINDAISDVYATTEYNNPFISFDGNGEPGLEDALVYSKETEIYDFPENFSVDGEENVTNPFIESTTTDISKQRKKLRNKKKIKSTTQNYKESSTNPFLAESTTTGISENETNLNPFVNTNPFDQDLQNTYVANEDVTQNPFTENPSDTSIPLTEYPEIYDTELFSNELGNKYTTEITPFTYIPTQNVANEGTAIPEIHDYDLNTVEKDVDEFYTTEGVSVLSTTEKPAVWFKTDADFWEKLSNRSIPYDVVYFFQARAQPLVEKDTKTIIFPNGTIVQEFVETIWERAGDTAPILVKSSKTIYPEEKP